MHGICRHAVQRTGFDHHGNHGDCNHGNVVVQTSGCFQDKPIFFANTCSTLICYLCSLVKSSYEFLAVKYSYFQACNLLPFSLSSFLKKRCSNLRILYYLRFIAVFRIFVGRSDNNEVKKENLNDRNFSRVEQCN